MPRPIEALIHTHALAHNLRRARSAAPDARVWAVVKANAYGHGIARAYAGLQAADGFALLDLDEAQALRELGWRGPILLLEGCFDARDLETCSRLDLWHTVHCEAQIDWLAKHKTHTPQHVFLKMNSGMNRLGFTPQTFRSAWLRLSGLTQVEGITLMTHFANADTSADTSADSSAGASADPSADTAHSGAHSIADQLAVFEAAASELPGDRSLCNSAATLRFGAGHARGQEAMCADWVRPGIMLYGSSPDFPAHSASDWNLQPAMTLRTEIIAVQDIEAGAAVGYGSAFTAERAMRIGVAACGYADGYPRAAPTGTPVLVDGVRTRLVGRVSMDMVTVDLTPMPGAGAGSEVTLWGCGPNDSVLPIDEVAQPAGTVGYELMCALALRVPTRTA